MDLSEFVQKFEEIKAMKWIPSKRRGSTGIGYTLEELLDIPENNVGVFQTLRIFTNTAPP